MTLPDTIGQYEIHDHIGAGGMATVYKGYHARLDRHVAVKVMHQSFLQDPNFRARFEREARIVARLEHRSIVPIYDFNDHQGQPYLVMKYIEGETLKDRLRQGALTTTEIVTLMDSIASALTYAHQQGILHRDVKPSNIILDDRGTPYLTDFGLARMAQQGESTMSADMMLGTPHYISPEQAQGKIDLDARTDVYSLGIILYELVVGRVPFTGDSTYAIVHDHIYSSLPSPGSFNAEVSPAVEQVLLKALAKNPQDRYDTPDAMIADYKRAVAGDSPHAAAESPRQAVSPRQPESSRPQPPHIPLPPPPPQTIGERIGEWGENFGKKVETWATDFAERMEEAGAKIEASVESTAADIDRSVTGKSRRHPKQWRQGATWRRNKRGEWGWYTDDDDDDLSHLSAEEQIRARVEKRLEERSDFISHLMVYLVINTMLWGIWLFTGGGFPWPIFPGGGWGIGLIFHYIDYYTKYGAGRHRRESLIQREMEREMSQLYSSGKAKNDVPKVKNEALFEDDAAPTPGVRLTGDGEFTDSYIEELRDSDDPNRRYDG